MTSATVPRPIITVLILILALAVAAIRSPATRLVAAQEASDLTLSLTSSAKKAKIGDIVRFTVRVENTGTVAIPDLNVSLSLPDALSGRAVSCPGETGGSPTNCRLGDFAPGSLAEVVFFVEVTSREGNGVVGASASSSSIALVSDIVPQLKLIGSPRGK
jgi:uncharacterized repeat protein (TIGR01451 family)